LAAIKTSKTRNSINKKNSLIALPLFLVITFLFWRIPIHDFKKEYGNFGE
jgi:hypothetical protein